MSTGFRSLTNSSQKRYHAWVLPNKQFDWARFRAMLGRLSVSGHWVFEACGKSGRGNLTMTVRIRPDVCANGRQFWPARRKPMGVPGIASESAHLAGIAPPLVMSGACLNCPDHPDYRAHMPQIG